MTDTAASTRTQVVTPYLAVHDGVAALAWYGEVFGAFETSRYTGEDGRLGHAEIAVGGATIMLSDEFPEIGVTSPRTLGGTATMLHLEVVDVDHSYRRAVEAGAAGEREPADQGHGNRNAVVRDPFGHRWMLTQPIAAERAAAAPPADDQKYVVTGKVAPVEPGYLVLHRADRAAAERFFGALFGWRVEPGGGHVANTRFPLGFGPSSGDGAPVTAMFRVDDLEAYATKVVELGGEVRSRAEHPSGANAECVDDQGVRFDLWQPAPGY